ncbi:hypothetical protein BpHYR1_040275 [Brachionus plicatilis]|uniref:Uncharacterized protein n=1 Tax=Brachionus plicatilis TaxID=10195 RepID=A0A3M7R8C8_BRAPC|nr:hypothetical protein BpHYR1_040275 [Brachionus plicatilis]
MALTISSLIQNTKLSYNLLKLSFRISDTCIFEKKGKKTKVSSQRLKKSPYLDLNFGVLSNSARCSHLCVRLELCIQKKRIYSINKINNIVPKTCL